MERKKVVMMITRACKCTFSSIGTIDTFGKIMHATISEAK